MVFEDLCDSDFSMLRDFMRYAICVKFVRFLNNNISMNMNVYPEMLTVSRTIILSLSLSLLLFKQLYRCLEGPHKCLGKKPRCRLEINF